MRTNTQNLKCNDDGTREWFMKAKVSDDKWMWIKLISFLCWATQYLMPLPRSEEGLQISPCYNYKPWWKIVSQCSVFRVLARIVYPGPWCPTLWLVIGMMSHWGRFWGTGTSAGNPCEWQWQEEGLGHAHWGSYCLHQYIHLLFWIGKQHFLYRTGSMFDDLSWYSLILL